MKFLAESPRTVEHLQHMGHEATRLSDLGMATASDQDILDYASQHDFILLTMDLDFGGLLAQKGSAKPSAITFRLENPEVGRINRILGEKLSGLEKELSQGVIVIVEETRLRVRGLPI